MSVVSRNLDERARKGWAWFIESPAKSLCGLHPKRRSQFFLFLLSLHIFQAYQYVVQLFSYILSSFDKRTCIVVGIGELDGGVTSGDLQRMASGERVTRCSFSTQAPGWASLLWLVPKWWRHSPLLAGTNPRYLRHQQAITWALKVGRLSTPYGIPAR